jgi:streptogramin lyase
MTTPQQNRFDRLARIFGTMLALTVMLWEYAGAAEPNPLPLSSQTVSVRYTSETRASSLGEKFTVSTYEVPTSDAVPHILAIDPDDHVWFSESGGRFAGKFLDVPPQNKVGRIEVNGAITEWSLPGEGTSPMGIVFDRNGNLWIAERLANRITRLSRNGTATHFPVPTPGAWPTGIALDSRGGVWFTETKGNRIGRVDPNTGEIEEFRFKPEGMSATGIAVDSHDRVWVAGRDANLVAKWDPQTREFQYFPLSTPNAKPCGIVVDSRDRVWFTQRNAGKLAMVSVDGVIQEFVLKDRSAGPFLPVVDRQDGVWFSQLWSNKIVRFNPELRTFEEFQVASEPNHVAGLAIDSRGNLWFASQTGNKVGTIVRQNLAHLSNERSTEGDRIVVNNADKFEFHSYEVPTRQSIPGIVEVAPDDTVWFTQMGGGFVVPGFPPGPPGRNIGYIRDGLVGELMTPTAESGPTSIAVDSKNGDVWVTLRAANKIALVRNYIVTEFDLPLPDTFPVGITVDGQHNVWVALSTVGALARRTPDGEWRVLYLPNRNGNPRTVYADRFGSIWYTEKDGNRLGVVDQSNWTVRDWAIPTRVAWPLSLSEDDEGNIWFAEMRADKLARFDRKLENITEFKLPARSAPFKILFDSTRNLFWISAVFGNSVLRFDVKQEKVTDAFRVPNEGVWLGGIARTSDGCFWITEQFGNRVDQLCIRENYTKRANAP